MLGPGCSISILAVVELVLASTVERAALRAPTTATAWSSAIGSVKRRNPEAWSISGSVLFAVDSTKTVRPLARATGSPTERRGEKEAAGDSQFRIVCAGKDTPVIVPRSFSVIPASEASPNTPNNDRLHTPVRP